MARAAGKANKKGRVKQSDAEAEEIARLNAAIAAGAPPAGTSSVSAFDKPPLADGGADPSGEQPAAADAGFGAAKTFAELPLSSATLGGLQAASYTNLTAIQRAAIPHALAGRDILGAAKTGSGKTLAFLVPLLEALFRARWGRLDGLGALVLTPTRELAMQIFEELRRVGRRHGLSAGMLIGGKNIKTERDVVNSLNVLVATPGRLLQHMDETPGFDAGGLQVLVMDEADRILDMGFRAALDAILENLPRERQTLLFSATQTKSVRDLARLSLRAPEYLAVHAEAAAPTPAKLQQAVMEVPLQQKLDALWSFVKAHLKCKVIVFMSTCKQVRYVYEAFRRLRPGVTLRALHGKMKQMKRLAAFYDFCEAKSMVLFATDVAARGLDFPSVDWVVQADCPEDVASYIHRVGRTARYVFGGRALLLLTPGEAQGMHAALAAAGVPAKPLRMNPEKTQAIGPALQALCSKDGELKDMAQRAVVSYVRSVFLQPNRAVFDVASLPLPEYAAAMGLLAAPKLRFLKRQGGGSSVAVAAAAGPAAAAEPAGDSEDSGGGDGSGSDAEAEADARGGAAGPPPASAPAATAGGGSRAAQAEAAEEGSEEDDLLVVKRRDVLGTEVAAAAEIAVGAAAETASGSRKKKKKLRIRADAHAGAGRVVFDDEGQAREPLELLADQLDSGGSEPATAEERFQQAAERMARRDASDRKADAEQRRQLRAAKKAKKRAAAREASGVGGGGGPMIGSGGSGDDHESGSDSGGYSSGGDGGSPPPPRGGKAARLSHRHASAADPPQLAAAPALPEIAHAGMVPARKPAAEMALADREALALRLLSG